MNGLNVEMLKYERDQLIHEATAAFDVDTPKKVIDDFVDKIRSRFSYLISVLEFQDKFTFSEIQELQQHEWTVEFEYEATKIGPLVELYIYKENGSFFLSLYDNVQDDLCLEGLRFERLSEIWDYMRGCESSKDMEMENKVSEQLELV